MDKKQPLIAVVGPTASGKTAVGAALAKEYNGEVVSADSMQIYKGMNIATAKPTDEEMLGIPHHLISLLEMDASFSVADYVRIAKEKISEIALRGKLPVLVGGTGLYVSSLIDNISFDNALTDGSVRKQLAEECARFGNEAMLDKLREIDPETAAVLPVGNITRIIRAIEVYEVTGIPFSKHKELSRLEESPYNVCMIGLNYADRNVLYDRINRRVDLMVEKGMVEECKAVFESEKLGTACQAIGYKEFIPYFKGEKNKEECIDKIKQDSRRYAKRQLTWFRRDERINWLELTDVIPFDKIIEECKKIVAKSNIL
ncbi:MAG: tRNA (adenosine(37)-N6)-dimethylallyltransferase MiaA [Oscillospiraceae bacterium]|nr:tRNA (adenosine(37)-N6)-dimethylallyltransferase MiaA [Oscillospiraceae bacterium]